MVLCTGEGSKLRGTWDYVPRQQPPPTLCALQVWEGPVLIEAMQFVQLHWAIFWFLNFAFQGVGHSKKAIHSRTQLSKHLCLQHSFKLPMILNGTPILNLVPYRFRTKSSGCGHRSEFQSWLSTYQLWVPGHILIFPEIQWSHLYNRSDRFRVAERINYGNKGRVSGTW